MLGLPASDGDRFRGFVNVVLEGVDRPQADREAGIIGFFQYLKGVMEDHLEHPRDDLTSYLLASEIDGEPVDPFWVTRTVGLLMIAGIDTTWSAIGASIWHLASTPSDRERLVAEPDAGPDRDRGAAAGLCAGHDGPPGPRGHRGRRDVR